MDKKIILITGGISGIGRASDQAGYMTGQVLGVDGGKLAS